ncbi:hypothetical protein IJM86_06825 [bacterium]|nr:hypothetical protein [bacterium]
MCRDVFCTQDFTVAPGKIEKVGAGIKTYLPQGRGVKMYARSSLPSKMHLMLANAVAIIDSDYRGEYLMQFYNFTDETVMIEKGSRVAQIEIFESYPFVSQGQIPSLEMLVDADLYHHFEEKYPTERGT